jgi:MFS transporter, putative metabolite:H+ symporter
VDLFALLDDAPLNRRYWMVFALLAALAVFETFNFRDGGYLVRVIAAERHLTYGQAAVILASEPVGAMIGALLFGVFADNWGRKGPVVIGAFICAAGAGAAGLAPSGSWQVFAVLRLLVGVGETAGVIPALIILVELTPTRRRTLLVALYLVCATIGSLLMLRVAQAFFSTIGWRGLAALGVAPAVVGALIWLYVPESARWLAAKGRFAEAQAGVAQYLGVPLQSVPMPDGPSPPPHG